MKIQKHWSTKAKLLLEEGMACGDIAVYMVAISSHKLTASTCRRQPTCGIQRDSKCYHVIELTCM
jgi:hypothetical protein